MCSACERRRQWRMKQVSGICCLGVLHSSPFSLPFLFHSPFVALTYSAAQVSRIYTHANPLSPRTMCVCKIVQQNTNVSHSLSRIIIIGCSLLLLLSSKPVLNGADTVKRESQQFIYVIILHAQCEGKWEEFLFPICVNRSMHAIAHTYLHSDSFIGNE